VTMGTIGDRIGRRRLLLTGAAAFGAASVLAAYSLNPDMLIAARALLGIAGATLAPSTLSLIRTMFPDPRQMGMAIGIWAGCFSVGAIIGPIVGGAMLDNFWWGSVFLLGVPAMLLLLVLGPAILPEYRNPDAGRLDVPSVVLSLATILPAVYGLKQLAKQGLGALPIATVVVGVAFGVLFARRQRALRDPLLDLSLFNNRSFTGALSGLFLGTMLMGAIMLFITEYLQLVQGLSPLRSGLWMLPAVGANTVSFLSAPLLARRIRPAYLISGGLLISVVGLLVMTWTPATGGPGVLVTGFSLMFFGAGPMVTLGTNLVIGSAPQEKAGSAAALNETSGQFGFALGIAVLGSIGAAIYRNDIADAIPPGIPAGAAAAARDTIAGARDAAGHLPDQLGAALLTPARAAFTDGLHAAVGISAVVLLCVAVLVVTVLRHVDPLGAVPDGDATVAGTESPTDDSVSGLTRD